MASGGQMNKCGTCKAYNTLHQECMMAYRTDIECEGYRPQTNADRIRAMTEKELAEWFCFSRDCLTCPYCNDCGGEENGVEKWLKARWR